MTTRRSRTLVAGVDSSTQATKVVVREAVSGALVRSGRAPHPTGTEVDPAHWLAALHLATDGGLLDGVAAISVAAQQHGMIALDAGNRVIRPAMLWNDVRSADAAAALIAELGGPGAWAQAIGSVPVPSFTVTKLRWLADHEPDNARRTAAVLLPHDYLTWHLTDLHSEPVTDRGDASGTGYWSPTTAAYRDDLVASALGHVPSLPPVVRSNEVVGETPRGAVVGPGTGDNMGAALGLGVQLGDVVVSIGTSATVFAVTASPVADATGAVAGFADATGRFLPLVCMMNGARVLSAAAAMTGVSLDALDDLALSAAPGAGGLVLLPYLEGERTPNRPHARGVIAGITPANATQANVARAAVEGLLCGLGDCLDALKVCGVRVNRVLLIGGAGRSRAVQALAPGLLGSRVEVPAPSEYVADGAARQAAWVLAGGAEPPAWPTPITHQLSSAEPAVRVREAYAAVRDGTG